MKQYIGIFVILEIIFGLFLYINFLEKIDEKLQNSTADLSSKYKIIISEYSKITNTVFNNNINIDEVLELIYIANTQKDEKDLARDRLYQKLKKLYSSLKSIELKQLHFHILNGESFLRFHKPKKYGDFLFPIRESIELTHLTKSKQSAFEEGRIYNGFRFVYPLSYKNKFLGSVETSISFEGIKKELIDNFNGHYGFIIKRDIVEKKVFKEFKNHYVKSNLSDRYSYEKKFFDEFFERENITNLNRKLKNLVKDNLDTKEAFATFVDGDFDNYLVTFLPIYNINKNQIAYLIAYQKDSYRADLIVDEISIYLYFTVLIFMILSIIYLSKKRIKESEERFKLAIESSKDGIWDWDLNKNSLYISHRLKVILGYSESDTINSAENIIKLIHPKHIKKVRESIDNYLKGKTDKYETIYQIKTKNNGYKWILDRGLALFDESEKAYRMIGFYTDITDIQNTKNELELNKELLSSVINSTNDLIFYKDENLKYLGCNDAFLEFVGKSESQVIGKSDYDIFKKEQADFFRNNDRKIFEKENVLSNYEWVKYPNNKDVFLLTNKSPLKHRDGRVFGLVGFSRDMSILKLTQDKLKFNEKYFKTVFDTQKDIILITENDRLHNTNRAFFEFFHKYSSLEEFIEDNECVCTLFEYIDLENYINGDLGKSWIKFVKNSPDRIFKVAIKKDDVRHIFSIQVKEMDFDSKDRNIIVLKDITELENYQMFLEDKVKKEVDKRLKNEEMYRQIASSSFDGILTVDEYQNVLTFNQACENIFKYSEAEVINKNVNLIIKENSFLQEYNKNFKKFALKQINELHGGMTEVIGIDKSGAELQIELSISSVSFSDRLNSILVIRDLTDKKVLEKEKKEQENILIQQSKMAQMGEMIGAIAHQWKQPLNAIALLIQNLESDYEYDELTEESLNDSVDRVMKQVNFMSETISDFRNFFKPSKTKTIFSLKKAIDDILNLLNIQFKKHNIKIATQIDLSNDKILGYENEFKQVILNILNNSKDAIEERYLKEKIVGEIQIRIYKDNNFINIEFSDNGIGIKNEVIDKIFEPYITTKGENGTGIGLYMSRTIIENMSGKLSAKNSENGGATFTISILSNF